ncbi:MAG: hypothetical protein GY714_10655 [Desulfobacterales bacterium]|nr:hypothetical protein [Desulfobacterales bacterium]
MLKISLKLFFILFLFVNTSIFAEKSAYEKDIYALYNKYPEAKLMTSNFNGKEVIIPGNLPIKGPDRKIYVMMGIIENYMNNYYVVKIKDTSKRFFFKDKIETKRGKKTIKNLNKGNHVTIYGRYKSVISYKTVMGTRMTSPAFEALHVEKCKYINNANEYSMCRTY